FGEPTPLPFSHRSGLEKLSDEHASAQVKLSEAATEELRQCSRQQQVTINTVVQAAWALLLSRYSGEQDVVYGATVSGRPVELGGVEEMVGLFINTLPVRVRVRAEQEVGEWLRQLQIEQVEMRQYEYSALVEVQGWSEVARGQAMLESIVVFENYPLETVFEEQVAGLQEEHLEVDVPETLKIGEVHSVDWAHYPITVAAQAGRKLEVTIRYDCGRFEAETVRRLAEHYERLLDGIIADGAQMLGQVEMLSESERQQILYGWNQTQQVYAADQSLAQLFEAQVEQRAEAVALVSGAEE